MEVHRDVPLSIDDQLLPVPGSTQIVLATPNQIEYRAPFRHPEPVQPANQNRGSKSPHKHNRQLHVWSYKAGNYTCSSARARDCRHAREFRPVAIQDQTDKRGANNDGDYREAAMS
jgi:hypothetical protein